MAVEPAPVAGSRAVRAAVRLFDAEPNRAWRVTELAAEVGVSPRTLQQAFQRELGMSPLERLRITRLDRARRDLVDADPASTSVTEIASRWGFFHLGRFSATYRDAYQESPSQTLAG